MKKEKKSSSLQIVNTIIGLLVAAILFTIIIQPIKIMAAGSVQVTEIDYDNFTLTIQVSEKDNKVFFSDSKMSKWEELIGDIVGNQIIMDISFITASRDYILTLKGDISTDVVSVIIPKQKTDLKLTYDKLTGLLETQNLTAGTPLFWRKSVSTVWHELRPNKEGKYNLKPEIEEFLMKGVKLYFRIPQTKGTSASNPGKRPSKEILLSVAKRGTAPSITIDGSKLSIGVKPTYVYKRIGIDSDWKKIENSTTKLNLSEFGSDWMASETADGTKAITIMFRIQATKTAVESKTKSVTIPIQEKAPRNVTVTYPNANSFVFNVKERVVDGKKEEEPSVTIPYEYTIVTPTEQEKMKVNGSYQLDYTKVSWTAITSDKDITIDSTKAPKNSILYVRKKTLSEIATGTNKRDFSLASYPYSKAIDGYPDPSQIGKKEIVKLKGAPLSDATFIVTIGSGVHTEIDTIKCNGTELKFVQTKNGNDITITLTSVEEYETKETNLGKTNKLVVTLKNGEVVNMDKDKEVTLTIKEGVKVTDNSMTKYRGIAASKDDLEFGFTIIDDSLKGKENMIESISLDSKSISNNYIESVSSHKVTITLQDNDDLIRAMNELAIGKHKVKVTLINGLVLDDITLTIKEIGTMKGNMDITKTEGVEWTKDLEIVLTLEEEYKEISFVCMVWNTTTIACNSSKKDGVITVTVPKDKVNEIETGIITFNQSFPIMFHFDNDAIVQVGKLRINKKTNS